MGAADQLRWMVSDAFANARWHVESLADDEYCWEPVDRCWAVRPRASAVTGWGTGEFLCEDTWPPPDPVPVTTIAWRIVHVAAWTDVYRDWTFGDAAASLRDFEVPGRAADAVAWLCRAQDAFAAAVEGLTDADLDDRRPAHYGPHLPVWYLVQSIAVEHVHHGAEIGALRDLHRRAGRLQPAPPLP